MSDLGDFLKSFDKSTGDIICDMCDGRGFLRTNDYEDNENGIYWVACPKCDLTGKLTWIEQVFGKQL
jgi:DnaJ-class molecular chaperone